MSIQQQGTAQHTFTQPTTVVEVVEPPDRTGLYGGTVTGLNFSAPPVNAFNSPAAKAVRVLTPKRIHRDTGRVCTTVLRILYSRGPRERSGSGYNMIVIICCRDEYHYGMLYVSCATTKYYMLLYFCIVQRVRNGCVCAHVCFVAFGKKIQEVSTRSSCCRD